jgi:hypothetical protein
LNAKTLETPVLGLHPSRLARADARIADYDVEATELIDLARYGRRSGNGGEIAADGSLGPDCRKEGVAAPTFIPPAQNDLMALLDQELGGHETEAVR